MATIAQGAARPTTSTSNGAITKKPLPIIEANGVTLAFQIVFSLIAGRSKRVATASAIIGRAKSMACMIGAEVEGLLIGRRQLQIADMTCPHQRVYRLSSTRDHLESTPGEKGQQAVFDLSTVEHVRTPTRIASGLLPGSDCSCLRIFC